MNIGVHCKEAMDEVSDLIERLLRQYAVRSLVVGLDVNTELQGSDAIAKYVGGWPTGSLLDDRRLQLVEFMQHWNLQAANMFAGDGRTNDAIAQLRLVSETPRLCNARTSTTWSTC